MAYINASKTICTIHSIDDTKFIHDSHNKQFLVDNEEEDYEPDPYASRASPFSPSVYSDAGERTPTQTSTEPFLRITTDHEPRDPTAGFVFGKDPDSCDVLLAGHRKISSRHFSIGPNQQGHLVLKNRSQHKTLIASSVLGKISLEAQTAIPEDGAEIEVQPRRRELKIKIRFPGYTNPDFQANWKAFLKLYSHKVPLLTQLELKTSTTSSSYHRGEKLGSGSSGTVYRAIHRFTGQHYAIKEFDGKSPAGIFSEAKILRGLSHVNIVKFHEYGMNDGPPWLVMGIVDGGDLRKAQKSEPLALPELRDCCSQILNALAYIHDEKNIMHRDIKPANIMVKRRRPILVQLSDFGLACSIQRPDPDHQGTPRYAAPEMIARERYDSKVDIWPLGIIVLEFSTGLPTSYRKANRECLSTLEPLLRSPQSPILQFTSSLLRERPRDRTSATESLHLPFLSQDSRFGSSSASSGPSDTQLSHLLAPDEEPTNPFGTQTRRQYSDNLSGPSSHQSTAFLASPHHGRPYAAIPDTAPGTPNFHEGSKRKTPVPSTSHRSGKRRSTSTYSHEKPSESHSPGSDDSTVVYKPGKNGGLNTRSVTNRESVGPSGLPSHRPRNSQVDNPRISHYTERSYSNGSYLAPANTSFQQLQVPYHHTEGTDGAQVPGYSENTHDNASHLAPTDIDAEWADMDYRNRLLDGSGYGLDPTYNADTNVDNVSANCSYADNKDIHIPPANAASTEDLSHLSTRSVFFEHEQWCVVVHQQRICMRKDDFYLNASQMWAASSVSKSIRDSQYRKLRNVAKVEGRQLWVPFMEGELLSKALGLDGDLRNLLSYAPEHLRTYSEANYLLPGQQRVQPALNGKPQVTGYDFFTHKNVWISFRPNDRTVNITQILKANSIQRWNLKSVENFLGRKAIEHRNSCQGTFIPYEDAVGVCKYFDIEPCLEAMIQATGS